MNLGLILGIDFGFFHTVPLPEETFTPTNSSRPYPDFRACVDGEILDMRGDESGGYYILYQSEDGTCHVGQLHGSDILRRYWWKSTGRITVTQEPFRYERGNRFDHLRFTVSGGAFTDFSEQEFHLFSIRIGSRTLNGYMVCALLLLFLEWYVLKKLMGKQ